MENVMEVRKCVVCNEIPALPGNSICLDCWIETDSGADTADRETLYETSWREDEEVEDNG